MRYNLLIPFIILPVACIDPDTPVEDATTGADSIPNTTQDTLLDTALNTTVDTAPELSSPVGLAPAMPEASIYLAMTETTPDEAKVQIRIRQVEKLSALSFRLKFDPTALKVTKIDVTPIFGDEKKGVFVARDMGDGTISLGGAFYGLRSSKTFNDELIATVSFQVLKDADTTLSFPPGWVLAIGSDRKTVAVNFVDATLKFAEAGK